MGAPFGAGEVWKVPWRGEPPPQRGGHSSAKGNALVRPSPGTLRALKGRNSTRNPIPNRGRLIIPPNQRVERLTRARDCGAWRKGSAAVEIHFSAQILSRSRQKKRVKCSVLCRFAHWKEAPTHLHTYALLRDAPAGFQVAFRGPAGRLGRDMTFLPVVQRELYTAARQRKTWWFRLAAGAGAIALAGLVLLTTRGALGPQRVGTALFQAVSGFGFLYGLLAGPLATADCLSVEKRQGTLGLLFLTDLKGYDVVLGKLAAHAVNLTLGMGALLPVLALPLLLGGVSWGQVGWVAALLLATLLLSLAAGLWASSRSVQAHRALLATVFILGFLNLGLPWLKEEVFRIRTNEQAMADWLYYAVCPLRALAAVLDGWTGSTPPRLMFHLVGMVALSGCFLGDACRRLPRAWQEAPAPARRGRWRKWLQGWVRGTTQRRATERASDLAANPIFWLDHRHRARRVWIWMSLVGFLVCWGASRVGHGGPVRESWIFATGLLMHSGLCLALVFEAVRPMNEDRWSGALELVLVTPMKVRELLRGRQQALWHEFGGPMLAILMVDLLLLAAGFEAGLQRGPFRAQRVREFLWTGGGGVVVFGLNAWALSWLGMRLGLTWGRSSQAALLAGLVILLLPWVVFYVSILILVTCCGGRLPAANATGVLLGYWLLLETAISLGVGLWARRQLAGRLRSLAGGAPRRPLAFRSTSGNLSRCKSRDK